MNTFLAKRYLRYKLFSTHARGHGIHSPFVYELIRDVFMNKKYFPEYSRIIDRKNQLENCHDVIEIKDFGAGSTIFKDNRRKVSHLAKVSAVPQKYGRLLFRLVRWLKPETIVELGSCVGIGTSYLALGNAGSEVVSIEGDPGTADIAKRTFDALGIRNVNLVCGNFDEVLEDILANHDKVDLAYIDGNHRKEPTLRYFDLLKKKTTRTSLLIFDDIHLSPEMEEAWELIKADETVTITVDIFRFGLVFFNEGTVKQHFTIRY